MICKHMNIAEFDTQEISQVFKLKHLRDDIFNEHVKHVDLARRSQLPDMKSFT